jgi:segregation and condensation protein B
VESNEEPEDATRPAETARDPVAGDGAGGPETAREGPRQDAQQGVMPTADPSPGLTTRDVADQAPLSVGEPGDSPEPLGVEEVAAIQEIEKILTLSREEIRAVLEALVFVSPEPVTPRQLASVLRDVPRTDWEPVLDELRADYARPGRGLQLVEVAGGYQITTRPDLNDWVQELLDPKTPTRLTIQALETLAVIAYKQPVTLPEVIELRGVKSGGVLKTLLEKRLIRIVGRKEVVGRPMLYGTTKQFLLHFGLKELAELPKIEEFAEVLGEEVDVVGLKRAVEAPTMTQTPLFEAGEDAAPEVAAGEGESQAADTSDSAPTGGIAPSDEDPAGDESD